MAVPEPEVAAQWYKDNIGGEFIDGRTDRLLFGTTRIMFLNGDAPIPSTGGVVDHLGFSFTDLAAAVERVRAAGATAVTASSSSCSREKSWRNSANKKCATV